MQINLLLTGGILSALLAGCAAAAGNGKETVTQAAKAGDTTDGTPAGMVSFFSDEACPPGWVNAEVANGRLIVGVTNPTSVGKTVGTAMTDKTSSAHASKYAVSGSAGTKDLVAASGHDNKQGIDDGKISGSGETDSDDSRLPFVQLVVCQKQ